MLVVISPAKNLDYDTPSITQQYTQPDFLDDASELIQRCRKLAPAQIGSLMKISDKLAGLNAARYDSWQLPFDTANAKQAMLAFNGDVYTGLQASCFSQEDLDFAQGHLRILSGLYGLLRPLDLMQPYRLEMGTKLDTHRGKNLYEFWGSTITDALNKVLAAQQSEPVLVNLASNEYFKSVRAKQLEGEIISPVFKDLKNGEYKIISFFAKKARGLMSRYIIQNKITEASGLLEFDLDGYQYNQSLSSKNSPVFCRDIQPD